MQGFSIGMGNFQMGYYVEYKAYSSRCWDSQGGHKKLVTYKPVTLDEVCQLKENPS